MNSKNLNPLNDPEVAEMLTMSPEDQLWSFLDDCVPHDEKDAVLVMMGDFDVDYKNEDGNIAINGVPYCAMLTTPRGKPAGVPMIAFYQHPYTTRALG